MRYLDVGPEDALKVKSAAINFTELLISNVLVDVFLFLLNMFNCEQETLHL